MRAAMEAMTLVSAARTLARPGGGGVGEGPPARAAHATRQLTGLVAFQTVLA